MASGEGVDIFQRERALPVRMNSETSKRTNTLGLKIPIIKPQPQLQLQLQPQSQSQSQSQSQLQSHSQSQSQSQSPNPLISSIRELNISRSNGPLTSIPPPSSKWDPFNVGTGEIICQTITNSLNNDNNLNGDREEFDARHRRWRSESIGTSTMDNLEPWEFKGAYPHGPVCVYGTNLYLYSEPTLEECRQFDVIINVAKELNDLTNKFINDDQHEYFKIEWLHNSRLIEDLPHLTHLIQDSLKSGKRVLVHCQCGVSRSACLVMAYMMLEDHLDYNEAYERLKMKVPRVSPNLNLIYELMEWRTILNGNN